MLANGKDANMVGVSKDTPNLKSDFILRVFPNPVQEILYIESDHNIRDIRLYNSTGLTMINVQPDVSSKTLNVGQLQRGVYILQVTLDNGKKLTQKVIKE